MRPAYLEVIEREDNFLEITFKRSGDIGPGGLSVQTDCNAVSGKISKRTTDSLTESWTVECPVDSERKLMVLGLSKTMTNVLVHVQRPDGGTENFTLTYKNPVLMLSNHVTPILPLYLTLGIEHLLSGLDHVLFVIGLMLLIRDRFKLLQAITSFTVAHSITLALSTFKIVSLSQNAVEAVIALSILYIAVEIAYKGDKPGLTQRYPWIITFIFGLLHGLGFAGVLIEIGLPAKESGWALLLFNIGIELGQLLVIGLMVLLGLFINRFTNYARATAHFSIFAAYGIGIISTWWLLTRLTVIIS